MAIDTRQKRQNMLSFASPLAWQFHFEPDGAVEADDRAHLLHLYGGNPLGESVPSSDFITPAGGDDAPARRIQKRNYELLEAARIAEDADKLKFKRDIELTLRNAYDELNGIHKQAVFDEIKPFVKQKKKIPESQQIPLKLINWRSIATNRLLAERLLNELYLYQIERRQLEIEMENEALLLLMMEM